MCEIIPNSSSLSEPEILRNLKQLLAKNICNCKICSDHEKSLLIQYNDKQTQIADQDFFNVIGRVESALKLHRTQSHTLQKNVICPGCYMAMNLCRQKSFKFLKDEECETKTEMFSSDKSTEKEVKVIDNSTSDTNITELKNGIVSLSEDFFEYSAVSTSKTGNQKEGKQPVTLLDSQEITPGRMPIYSNCLCMTNFINSIRPPLSNNIYDT